MYYAHRVNNFPAFLNGFYSVIKFILVYVFFYCDRFYYFLRKSPTVFKKNQCFFKNGTKKA